MAKTTVTLCPCFCFVVCWSFRFLSPSINVMCAFQLALELVLSEQGATLEARA